jgi:hypothetical protein
MFASARADWAWSWMASNTVTTVVGVGRVELRYILLDARRVAIGEALGLRRTVRDTLRGEVEAGDPTGRKRLCHQIDSHAHCRNRGQRYPRRHAAVPDGSMRSAV